VSWAISCFWQGSWIFITYIHQLYMYIQSDQKVCVHLVFTIHTFLK
jgi:hypothetical protein